MMKFVDLPECAGKRILLSRGARPRIAIVGKSVPCISLLFRTFRNNHVLVSQRVEIVVGAVSILGGKSHELGDDIAHYSKSKYVPTRFDNKPVQ